jgi:hypothetical protein
MTPIQLMVLEQAKQTEKQIMRNEELYEYVLHFNPYNELWSAIPRDVYQQYFNNNEVDGVLKSKELTTLLSLIAKGATFVNSIT